MGYSSVFVRLKDKRMFVCEECGGLFDDPAFTSVQSVEWHGDLYPEIRAVSPCCSAGYITTKPCSICGEYIVGKYIRTENDDVICENCYIELDASDGGVI